MTRIYAAVALVVLLLAGSCWHERDERLRAEGQQELLTQRYDSLRQVAYASELALEAIRLQEDPRIAVAEERAAKAEVRAAAALARRPETTRTIVEHHVDPADTAVTRIVTAAVVEAMDSVEVARVRPLLFALAQKDSIIASGNRKLAAAEQANADLVAALAAKDTLVPPHPGRLERYGGTALKLAGGFAAGVLWEKSRH